MPKVKILIVGRLGMLGQELTRVFSLDEQYEVAGWDREDIDITDLVFAEKKIRAYKPEIILNAVAYNAVDACEESDEEYKKALLLNAEVPKFLARLVKEMGAVLVHYSTDYVFDGALEGVKKEPGNCNEGGCCGGNCHNGEEKGYTEEAVPNPFSRYGVSKYLGEQAVIESFVIPAQAGIQKSWIPGQARDDREEDKKGGGYYLIRLSKLFGKPAQSAQGKKSFFEKMLEIADSTKLTADKEKSVVQVVDDEKSCFTYAPDLAQATKELIESGDSFGIYHLVNTGAVTWYEAVQELYAQAHIGVTIQPVGSDAFPRKARRPMCSTLLNSKRPPLRPYQEALREYLSKM